MPTDRQSAERARAEQVREFFKSGGNGFETGGDEHEKAFSCSFDYMVESAAAYAALAVERERKTCADIAGGMTGPGNTVEQCKGYSDACRDIQRAIRTRDAERG